MTYRLEGRLISDISERETTKEIPIIFLIIWG